MHEDPGAPPDAGWPAPRPGDVRPGLPPHLAAPSDHPSSEPSSAASYPAAPAQGAAPFVDVSAVPPADASPLLPPAPPLNPGWLPPTPEVGIPTGAAVPAYADPGVVPSRTRRWRPLAAVAGVLAAALAVAAGVVLPRLAPAGMALRAAPPAVSSPGAVAGPAPSAGTSRDAAVGALLARRATAVTTRDAAAWSATQTAKASVPVFSRLAALPITVWSYDVSSTTGTASLLTLVVRVHLRFDVDTVDAVVPETMTLRRTGTGWLVSSEETAGKRAQPWDLGRLTVVHGTRSLVIGIDESTSVLRSYARLADTAVPQVTAVWGSDWSQRPVLVVPRTETDLARALDRSVSSLDGFAAVTTGELADAGSTRSALRVWTNTPGMDELSALGRQVVVRHEITHVATAAPDTPGVPLWLEEGFAEYVGYLGSGVALHDELRELIAAERRGDALVHLPSQAMFDGAEVDVAYEGADLACRLVAEDYGQAALVRLYRLTAAGTGSAAANLDAALREVTGSGTAAFEVAWRTRLRALAS